MFKNALLYRLATDPIAPEALAERLAATPFAECGPTQELSWGWVPPRAAHGALLESVSGQWIFRLAIETRTVPGPTLKKEVAKRVAQIEIREGRKPGKKERKEIADNVRLELLPLAFTKRTDVTAWWATGNLLVIGTASQAKADLFVTALIEAAPGLGAVQITTMQAPYVFMSGILLDEAGAQVDGTLEGGFAIGRACELRATDESKAVVRYAQHNLAIEEVRAHIIAGKIPSKLELVYNGRLSFTLTAGGGLTGIEYLDAAMVDDVGGEQQADKFDADVVLTTAELAPAIQSLIDAMGGELSTAPTAA